MIVWIIVGGTLCILFMLPATLFGWLCGKAALHWLHHRKPPLPPPI